MGRATQILLFLFLACNVQLATIPEVHAVTPSGGLRKISLTKVLAAPSHYLALSEIRRGHILCLRPRTKVRAGIIRRVSKTRVVYSIPSKAKKRRALRSTCEAAYLSLHDDEDGSSTDNPTAPLDPTVTPTATATSLPSASPTPPPTVSPSATATATPSATPTPSITPTPTSTFTATSTPTVTSTPTPSPTSTPTPSDCTQQQAPEGWTPIRTVSELRNIAVDVDAGVNVDGRFMQLCDLSLSGGAWSPLAISGVYEGNGKTISGLTIQAEVAEDDFSNVLFGLFSGIERGSVVRNLNLLNISIEVNGAGRAYVGPVVALAPEDSLVENVTVTGTISGSQLKHVGGVVGWTRGNLSELRSYVAMHFNGAGAAFGVSKVGGVVGYATGAHTELRELFFDGSILLRGPGSHVGGIVGDLQPDYLHPTAPLLENAHARGEIDAGREAHLVGGIIGQVGCNYNDIATCEVKNLSFSGRVVGKASVGGVIGEAWGNVASQVHISRVHSEGEIEGALWNVGGVVGGLRHSSLFQASSNAEVRALPNTSSASLPCIDRPTISLSAVGGIVGYAGPSSSDALRPQLIEDVSFVGAVQGGEDGVGGIVGLLQASNRSDNKVSRASSSGVVLGLKSATGGLFGIVRAAGPSTISINDSYSVATVSGQALTGAVAGALGACPGAEVSVRNVYASGHVSSSSSYPVNPIEGTLEVSSSYYEEGLGGVSTAVIGLAKSSSQLKSKSTFSGWDFISIWEIDEGVSTPALRDQQ